MPEFFRSRFRGRAGRVGYALLRAPGAAGDRASPARSSPSTTRSAIGFDGLGVPASKLTIVPNAPSLARFDPAAATRRDRSWPTARSGSSTPGALSPIYELDVVLEAMARLAERRPELPVCLDLYGRDFAEVPLRDRAAALGIADRVVVPRPDPDRGRPGGDRRAPTSASPRPDARTSPTSRSRPRPSSTPRWAGRSSRRACRWSSGSSATTS